MRFKIVNKKVFAAFVMTLLIIFSGLFFGMYYFASKMIKLKADKQKQDVVVAGVSPSETLVVNSDPNKSETQTQEVSENAEIPTQETFTDYQNANYNYEVRFPDKWQMNNDDSESKFEKIDNGSGKQLMGGGQTFWSNYADINKFNPENKPADFHLLSLTVYQDDSKSEDEFAKKLGVKEFSTFQVVEGKNITGKEYISGGLDDKNPNITAIFKKDNLFYVFKPAFINGDEIAADLMENIVKSFNLL